MHTYQVSTPSNNIATGSKCMYVCMYACACRISGDEYDIRELISRPVCLSVCHILILELMTIN